MYSNAATNVYILTVPKQFAIRVQVTVILKHGLSYSWYKPDAAAQMLLSPVFFSFGHMSIIVS